MGRRPTPRRPAGLRIKEWREHRGLTQQQLADLVGTIHVNISRWERGDRAMRPDTLEAIARALDIDPGSLWRLPGPSLDSMLNGVDDATRQRALEAVIAALVRKP